MNKELLLYLLTFAVIFPLTSCQAQTNEDWKINVGIKNVGTNRIAAASVKWGEFKFTAGIVSPGKQAVQVSFDHPIPETATVHCSLPDGKEITKTVPVKSAVPAAALKERHIEVSFEVNSNNGEVTVKFYHHVYMDNYWHLVLYDDK